MEHNFMNNGNLKVKCLGVTLYESLKKYSSKILQYIADTDETDTFGEVLTRSIRTALKLKEKGITKNDIVSSCTYNHKNSLIPFIASTFLGAISANFDPNLPELDTIHLLKLIQPKILFVSLESLPFMERCLKESNIKTDLVVFGDKENYTNFSDYLEPNSKEQHFKPTNIKDIKQTAAILFSSGSTGYPKGICLNHYTLLRAWNFIDFNVSFQPVALLFTTLYWISSLCFLINCIVNGHARVVCSRFDPYNTWKIIEKYKVYHMFMAPYHAVELLANRPEKVDISSLKYFLIGSCPVTKKLMIDLRKALPNTKILHGYSQSEAGLLISVFTDYQMQLKKPQSCGKIIKDYSWRVVDPSTEEVLGPNQKGELRLKCDFLMNGYYKMDSSTVYDSDGYYKTGDIIYYDEEECIYVVGRIKEMFKYRGWHILPAILEEVLTSHPAVKEAVVVGIPHQIDGEHPMGIVVLHKGYENITPKDIEKFLEGKVSEAQRLRAGVKIVGKIVRNTSGKVKRSVMRQLVLDGKI